MAKKKIARPSIAKDSEGELWMEYEGHTTNEVCQSPNGRWNCAIFRLQERTVLVLAELGKAEYKFLIPVPLVCGVSDSGVAAVAEFAEGGERRLRFFYPDGAVAVTEPIKDLQQTDRIFFDKKFAEVNLLCGGRILNSFHFGELDATVNTNALIYKRNEWIPILIVSAVVFVLLVGWLVAHSLK